MEDGRITLMSNSSEEETTKKLVVDTNISILVVDDDTTCLAIVAAILKKFKYQVVTVKHPNDALCTLRIKGGAFDLVVSDVHMPDMNGFELQQVIAQEFDLPVVLMSADEKEGVAVKGLESGAAYFILKPVSPDDVRDLWQFAAMKKKSQVVIHEEVTDTPHDHDNNHGDEDHQKTSADKNNACNNDIIAADDADAVVAAAGVTGSSSVNEDTATNKKESKRKSPRKEGSTDEQKGETSQSGSQKKPKVVWTNSLHNRFLEAIRSIGLDRAVPKRILEVMNVPGLTRENVASHLQKYRIFLRRVSDASCKIQYSADYKGLSRNMMRSSIESSSAAGTSWPPTLNLNTFSKFPYRNLGVQFRNNINNNIVSPLQNLETLPISSTFQSGFGQSRLLSNNETGPIIKPNILMSGFPNSISDRSYLRHDYQSRNSTLQGQYLSNNISLDDLTISTSTPVYDIGTSSNVVSSMQTTNYVGYSIANLKHCLSQKYDLPNSWRAPINNNDNNLTSDDGILQIGNSSSTHNVAVERNGSGGQLLSDVVADCYNGGQMMLPNSYNLPSLVCGDVENGGGVNEPALSPMFDLSDFDIFSTSQLQTPSREGDHHFDQTILADQVNISNQNQKNGGDQFITSSTFYGGTSHWDNTVASFDQAPNQNSGQGLGNSQEFGTSSQLNTTALLPPTQQQFGFNATSQTNKTLVSSTERDDDEFLESLLAPFAEDQTLEGI